MTTMCTIKQSLCCHHARSPNACYAAFWVKNGSGLMNDDDKAVNKYRWLRWPTELVEPVCDVRLDDGYGWWRLLRTDDLLWSSVTRACDLHTHTRLASPQEQIAYTFWVVAHVSFSNSELQQSFVCCNARCLVTCLNNHLPLLISCIVACSTKLVCLHHRHLNI